MISYLRSSKPSPVAADNGLPVSAVPATSGGTTPYRYLSASSAKAGVIKASAGQLYGSVVAENIGASPVYLRLYNKATAPATSDTPAIGPLIIPGATTGAGVVAVLPAQGVEFGTGISWRLTTGIADNNDSAVTDAEVTFTTFYK